MELLIRPYLIERLLRRETPVFNKNASILAMNRRLRKRQLYSNSMLYLRGDPVKASAERVLNSIDEMLRGFDIEKHGGEVMGSEAVGKEKIKEVIQSIKAGLKGKVTQQEIDEMRKRGRR